MLSINVQPARREPQTRVEVVREKEQIAQENPPLTPGTRADEAWISPVFMVHPASLGIDVGNQMPNICLAR
jgi:hypothetical protein